MRKLICEICGGDALLKEDSHFRCTRCGACYSTEQLKKMLNIPPIKANTVDSQPKIIKPTEAPKVRIREIKAAILRSLPKLKKNLPVILGISIPTVFFLYLFILILGFGGMLPQKSDAKNVAESHLEYSVESEDITLESVRFDSVDAKLFKTREEDTVGYFAYMDQPVKYQNADGSMTEYKDHHEKNSRPGWYNL